MVKWERVFVRNVLQRDIRVGKGHQKRETYCSTSSAVVSRIDLVWAMPALLIRIVGGPSCTALTSSFLSATH